MSLKITNKALGLVFAILLLVVLIFVILGGDEDERTFRKVLVDVDTTAITEILIYPKSQNHQEIKLFLIDSSWNVNLPSNKTASVSNQRIRDIFTQLLAIQPKRVAARDEAKWSEFQVDTTGSRVKVVEGSDVTLDLVIGRFSFQQPRTMNTFVRLFHDTDVYEVDGFLDMTFNQGVNSFRDGTIINADFNSWTQIQFNYPADSSFQLIKSGNSWLMNGIKADSSKTVNYLRRISRLSNTSFIDDFDSDSFINPTYTLNISTADFRFIEIKAYVDHTQYTVHSSENPETHFDGSSIGKTIFVGRSEFVPTN